MGDNSPQNATVSDPNISSDVGSVDTSGTTDVALNSSQSNTESPQNASIAESEACRFVGAPSTADWGLLIMGVHIRAKGLARRLRGGCDGAGGVGLRADRLLQAPRGGALPVVSGPPVTENTTPLYNAFACMSDRLKGSYGDEAPPRVAVGNVKDYTGKFSEIDGGNPITQGGALMVISALGKLGDAVRLHERFDTQIAEMELRYLENRYLGDGEPHLVQDNGEGQRRVPWKPYYGGSIMQTDYYIVGGITELNYNIQSGGAELRVNGAGPQARTFTVNVAADLRIIDTQTLEVIETDLVAEADHRFRGGAGHLPLLRGHADRSQRRYEEPGAAAARGAHHPGARGAGADGVGGRCRRGAVRELRRDHAAAPW
ncbi:MAG: CsgG/HfaB family protein [Arhodomonas sp.]|nr:CsgG/HfaB family protein [Arhodomonas sp.]